MNDFTNEPSESKEKAIAVINSCTSCDHIDNAIQYVELYYIASGDEDGYNELFQMIKFKLIELNSEL